MAKPIIELKNVSKKYIVPTELTLKETIPALLRGKSLGETFWALKDINFEVKKGDSLGVVGPNGSGKSTILKLLAGVTTATTGNILVKGRVAPLIELGAGFHPDMTGRENIYLNGIILGLTRQQVDEKFDQIVTFSELEEFIDIPVKKYSSGMYMRLGFSIAIHTNPEILLVDEVLAVGDASFQNKCLNRIRNMMKQGVTIVIVSHDTMLIETYCNKTLFISHGKMVNFGKTSEVIKQYNSSINYEQNKKSSPIKEASKDNTNNDVLIIQKTYTTDMSGLEKNNFLRNENVIVHMQVKFFKDTVSPVFGIRIMDKEGKIIFGTNTLWQKMKVKDYHKDEVAHIQFIFKNVLGHGQYDIESAVANQNAKIMLKVEDKATSFFSKQNFDTKTLVDIDSKITIG